jgi:hypothetical protein
MKKEIAEKDAIVAYKAFEPNWTCRGFKFKIGKTYTHDGPVRMCNSGFHACAQAQHCFSYYDFNPKNKIAEVLMWGTVETHDEDSKVCASNIKIVREIEWAEVLRLANTGVDNTGHSNSGYRNSGDRNSGYRNSGYRNSGDRNSGDRNSGYRNSGYRNSGYRNSGDRNSGDSNSGSWNSGTVTAATVTAAPGTAATVTAATVTAAPGTAAPGTAATVTAATGTAARSAPIRIRRCGCSINRAA